jgi:hypothetical protein
VKDETGTRTFGWETVKGNGRLVETWEQMEDVMMHLGDIIFDWGDRGKQRKL